MQANEEMLTKLVLKSEGGYCNDAGDPGGPTNFGITIYDVRKYLNPTATAADVKALRLDQAIKIYDAHYWDAMDCDDWMSGMDYVVYDYGINSGVARPPRVLQKLLGLPVTGKISDALIAKCNEQDQNKLIDMVCDERLYFMKQIKNGESWKLFGKGWSARVANVRKVAHQLARAPKTGVTQVTVEQQPAKTESTPKATHIDPKLPTKIAAATTLSGGGSVLTTQAAAAPDMWITLTVAGLVVVVVGGVGYLIYRSQRSKQLDVTLPYGMRPIA